MLDRLVGFQVHIYLQLLGLIILSVGLPLNKVVMSIGTIWLASNVLLHGDFPNYWKNWKASRLFWLILAILALHLIGLLYTDDFNYAFHDLNAKLPFFVIPIAVLAVPIDQNWMRYLLCCFLASLSITSFINLYVSFTTPQPDFRSISLFGSHIRYTLIVVMGVAVAIHLFMSCKKWRILWLFLISWFLFFIYQSQVFSGYISASALLLAVLVYALVKAQQKTFKWIISTGLITVFGVSLYLVSNLFSYEEIKTDFSSLEKKTPYGNDYKHDTTHFWLENGYHVMTYISEMELREAWNDRSEINYENAVKHDGQLKAILFRYMTSLGLTKDRAGMAQMTDQDIRNVERGLTNINQTTRSPFSRWSDLKNQFRIYERTGDPNGNSLTERIEHVKTAWLIIRDNWLIGVGTGDVQKTFNFYYEASDSKLVPSSWNRAHNQFLTFWITFGIIGFVFFLFFWIDLLRSAIEQRSFFALAFTFIAISSFIIEDTIETQQGVTFVAYFLSIITITGNPANCKPLSNSKHENLNESV